MSPASPEPATGRGAGGASTTAPTPAGRGGPLVAGRTRLLWLVVAVAAAYALLWLLGQGPLDQVYTAEWASRRIPWFYAPVTLLLAILSRKVLPTALSLGGFVLGVVLGELIGGPVYAAQEARLEGELAAGGMQSWEPGHPGWWIATLVFLALTAAGAFIAWRSSRTARP